LEKGIEALQKAVQTIVGTPSPSQVTCLFNLGTSQMKLQLWQKALDTFLLASQADPNDWQVVSKIVQCRSSLNQKEERTTGIQKLQSLHAAGKINAPRFCLEQIPIGNGNILVYQQFKFSGEFGAPFIMMIWENQLSPNPAFPKYCSLGSYDQTTAIAWETGSLPKTHRIWHCDSYYTNGSHATLFMNGYPSTPAYDVVRDILLNGMQNQANVISSSS